MWRANHTVLGEHAISAYGGDARFKLDDDLISDSHTLHHITSAFCGLYADPETQGANLTQLLYGEPFDLHYSNGKMAYGRSPCDGYVGWVSCDAIDISLPPTSHLVSALLAPLYKSPHLKQTPLMTLPMGAMVNATGTDKNGYIELECGRWIFAKHLAAEPRADMSLIDIAKLFIGTPYVWGGRTAMGIDCSGLVQSALAMQGIRCHRDSDMQYKTLGGAIEREALHSGDIAFFPGHVGIMVDKENVLHANATHMAVTIDPLDDVIRWVAKDTDKDPFLGGKRLSFAQ